MENRIALWDNLKFFLVTCVVIGHFVDQFTDISNIYDSIFLFIYSFHIPLFIFISGLMFKNKDVTSKVIFFISIGFAYKIVSAIVERLLGTIKVEFLLLSDGGISWFMFALAAYTIILRVIEGQNKRYILIFAIVLACFVGYDPGIGDFLYLSRIIMKSNIEFREGLDDLAGHYRHVLQLLGEDPDREGLEKTPTRVAKAMQVLTRGYTQDPQKVLTDALFAEKYNQMVIVKDIDFFSMCEHHMLPFYGKAHVAYIPNGHITGLSKIARVVDIFSHRLQVQERLTQQIKDCIQDTLQPLGTMVVIEAKHMCMQMRGIEKQNSITTTSAFSGAFNQAKTREEFMDLVHSDKMRI